MIIACQPAHVSGAEIISMQLQRHVRRRAVVNASAIVTHKAPRVKYTRRRTASGHLCGIFYLAKEYHIPDHSGIVPE